MYESTASRTLSIVARVRRIPDARRSRTPMSATTDSATTSAKNARTWSTRMRRMSPPRRSHGKKMCFSEGRRLAMSLHQLVHLDEGREERHGDEADDPAERDDHERLEEARERHHLDLHVRLVG